MAAARLLAAVMLVCTGAAAVAQEGPAGVLTALVERGEVSETVPIFAEVVASRDSDVAVRVAGVVTEVRVQPGDPVESGAILVRLDRDLLSIELRSAEASLAEARAGLEVARAGATQAAQALARVEGLRQTTAFSQSTLEDREAAAARARGEVAQAEARLLNAEARQARASYDLDRAEVRAPFRGVVLAVAADPGEYVQIGTPIARILDVDDVELEANVPSQYVGGLLPGTQVGGATEGGLDLTLTVRAVLPTEFANTRTRPVRFDIDALPRTLAVGESVTVSVPTGAPRDATLVPKDAVTQARGAWQVFVNADGKAEPRQVEIGESFGDRFEVVSGLAPGDEVVVRGNERLRPMQDIAPERIDRAAPDGDDAVQGGASDRGGADMPGEAGDAASRQAAMAN